MDPQNAIRGWWEQAYYWESPAIHMVVLKGTDSHSQVVWWGSGPEARLWKFNPGDTLGAAAALFDVPTDNSNIFCGGHSVLANGTLLATGGNEFSDLGIDHVNVFDPAASPPNWVSPRPRNMIESRYYPTNTALGDGTVLVAGGRMFMEMATVCGQSSVPEKTNATLVLGLRGLPLVQVSSPPGPLPAARTGHTIVFDDGKDGQTSVAYRFQHRAVMFGGSNASGQPLNDVWALYRDQNRNWSWVLLSPDPDPVWGHPDPRSEHGAVFDTPDSSLIVVGGRDSTGAPLGDVWELHLHRGANGRWSRLFPTGGDPSLARFGHTTVYDPVSRRALVFGGRGAALSDQTVWALSLADPPAWSAVTTTGTPPAPREGHAAVFDTKHVLGAQAPRSRMIVFGGNDDSGLFNDATALDFTDDPPAWSDMDPHPDGAFGLPAPRTGHTMVHDTEWDRLMILGGDLNGAASGGETGDFWHLTLGIADPIHNSGGILAPAHPDPPPGGEAEPNWARLYEDLAPGGLAGHATVFDPRWLHSSLPELFFPEQDFWLPLFSARQWQPLYPFHFLLPSGKVFFAGPSFFTNILNLETASWETYPWVFSSFRGGSAVMYRPGKILKCGDQSVDGISNTAIIDLTGPEASASWIDLTAGPPMAPRTEHNLTMLPTGEVMVTGGLRKRLIITTAVFRPQIWNPNTLTWSDSTLLAAEPAKRDYHSSINLLPDGRLLSGGGELRYVPTDLERFTATIYWPPYLFDDSGALAARPEIISAPSQMPHGGYMAVETPQAAEIASVCLIRPGATTHAFNHDQRYVPLDFVHQGGDGLIVGIPDNPNIVPVGNYFLFLVDQDSVPSIAHWLTIGAATSGSGSVRPRSDLGVYPNPFQGATTIEFRITERSRVRLDVFDVAGRRVRTLDDGMRDPGLYRLAWAGRDDGGRAVTAGVYFARLTAGDMVTTARLIRARAGR